MAVAVIGGSGEISRVGKFRVKDDLSAEGIPEAPIDGTEYARKNAAWVTITTGSGGSVLLATTYDETATTGLLFCSKYDVSA